MEETLLAVSPRAEWANVQISYIDASHTYLDRAYLQHHDSGRR